MNKKELDLYKSVIKDAGKLLFHAEEYQYGDFIIPCFADVLKVPIEWQISRVVQIRKEVGQFGSDKFFVRQAEGRLTVWENQAFYKVKDEYVDKILSIFQKYGSIDIDDTGEEIGRYYINGEDPKEGFIIPSPFPSDHVTPMKAIQSKLGMIE